MCVFQVGIKEESWSFYEEEESGSSEVGKTFHPKRSRTCVISSSSSSLESSAALKNVNDVLWNSDDNRSLSCISISSGEGPAEEAFMLKSIQFQTRQATDLEDLFSPIKCRKTSGPNPRRFMSSSSSSVISSECEIEEDPLTGGSIGCVTIGDTLLSTPAAPGCNSQDGKISHDSLTIPEGQRGRKNKRPRKRPRKKLTKKRARKTRASSNLCTPPFQNERRARTAATPRFDRSFREAVIASHKCEHSMDGLREARKVIFKHRSSPIKFPGMSSSGQDISLPKSSSKCLNFDSCGTSSSRSSLSKHHVVQSRDNMSTLFQPDPAPVIPCKSSPHHKGQPYSKTSGSDIPYISTTHKPKQLRLNNISV